MQSARPVFNALVKQVRRYHVKEFKAPHMNELPSPSGSWQRLNEQRQRKNNLVLAAGVTAFVVSATVFKNTVFFNYYAPEHYE